MYVLVSPGEDGSVEENNNTSAANPGHDASDPAMEYNAQHPSTPGEQYTSLPQYISDGPYTTDMKEKTQHLDGKLQSGRYENVDGPRISECDGTDGKYTCSTPQDDSSEGSLSRISIHGITGDTSSDHVWTDSGLESDFATDITVSADTSPVRTRPLNDRAHMPGILTTRELVKDQPESHDPNIRGAKSGGLKRAHSAELTEVRGDDMTIDEEGTLGEDILESATTVTSPVSDKKQVHFVDTPIVLFDSVTNVQSAHGPRRVECSKENELIMANRSNHAIDIYGDYADAMSDMDIVGLQNSSGAHTNQQNHSAQNLDQLEQTRVSVDIHPWKNKPDSDDHVMQGIVCQVIESDPQIERNTIGDHLEYNADPEGIIRYPSAGNNDIHHNRERRELESQTSDETHHDFDVLADQTNSQVFHDEALHVTIPLNQGIYGGDSPSTENQSMPADGGVQGSAGSTHRLVADDDDALSPASDSTCISPTSSSHSAPSTSESSVLSPTHIHHQVTATQSPNPYKNNSAGVSSEQAHTLHAAEDHNMPDDTDSRCTLPTSQDLHMPTTTDITHSFPANKHHTMPNSHSNSNGVRPTGNDHNMPNVTDSMLESPITKDKNIPVESLSPTLPFNVVHNMPGNTNSNHKLLVTADSAHTSPSNPDHNMSDGSDSTRTLPTANDHTISVDADSNQPLSLDKQYNIPPVTDSSHRSPTGRDNADSTHSLPTNRDHSMPMGADSTHSLPTNSDHSMPVDADSTHALPTNSDHSMPVDAYSTHSLPTNRDHSMPVDADSTHSLPTNSDHGMPVDADSTHSSPTNRDHSMPVDADSTHSLPTNTDHSMLVGADSTHSLPTNSYHSMPVDADSTHSLPTNRDHGMPVGADPTHASLSNRDPSMPVDADSTHSLPTNRDNSMPVDADSTHSLPTNRDHSMPVDAESTHSLPTNRDHSMPVDADSTHSLPTNRDHSMPVDSESTHSLPTNRDPSMPVVADSTHSLPTNRDHSMPVDADSTHASLSNRDPSMPVDADSTHSLPTNRDNGMPVDADSTHSLPTNRDHSMPVDADSTHSLPTNRDHSMPVDADSTHLSPTNRDHSMPVDADSTHSLPTNRDHSMPVDADSTHLSPTNRDHSMPVDADSTHLSPTNRDHGMPVDADSTHSLPTNRDHSMPVDADSTNLSPTNRDHGMPVDADSTHSLPTNSDHSMPVDCDSTHSLPTNRNHSMPVDADSTHSLPTNSDHSMPVDADYTHSLPTNSDHSMPVDADSTHSSPTNSDHSMPVDTNSTHASLSNRDPSMPVHADSTHSLPTNRDHSMPVDANSTHSLPTDRDHSMPVDVDSTHSVPTNRDHSMPVDADSTHSLSTNRDHSMPVDADSTHSLPTNRDHSMPVDTNSTHASPSNRDRRMSAGADSTHSLPASTKNSLPADADVNHTLPVDADSTHSLQTNRDPSMLGDADSTQSLPSNRDHTMPVDADPSHSLPTNINNNLPADADVNHTLPSNRVNNIPVDLDYMQSLPSNRDNSIPVDLDYIQSLRTNRDPSMSVDTDHTRASPTNIHDNIPGDTDSNHSSPTNGDSRVLSVGHTDYAPLLHPNRDDSLSVDMDSTQTLQNKDHSMPVDVYSTQRLPSDKYNNVPVNTDSNHSLQTRKEHIQGIAVDSIHTPPYERHDPQTPIVASPLPTCEDSIIPVTSTSDHTVPTMKDHQLTIDTPPSHTLSADRTHPIPSASDSTESNQKYPTGSLPSTQHHNIYNDREGQMESGPLPSVTLELKDDLEEENIMQEVNPTDGGIQHTLADLQTLGLSNETLELLAQCPEQVVEHTGSPRVPNYSALDPVKSSAGIVSSSNSSNIDEAVNDFLSSVRPRSLSSSGPCLSETSDIVSHKPLERVNSDSQLAYTEPYSLYEGRSSSANCVILSDNMRMNVSNDSITYVFFNEARSVGRMMGDDEDMKQRMIRPISEPAWSDIEPRGYNFGIQNSFPPQKYVSASLENVMSDNGLQRSELNHSASIDFANLYTDSDDDEEVTHENIFPPSLRYDSENDGTDDEEDSYKYGGDENLEYGSYKDIQEMHRQTYPRRDRATQSPNYPSEAAPLFTHEYEYHGVHYRNAETQTSTIGIDSINRQINLSGTDLEIDVVQKVAATSNAQTQICMLPHVGHETTIPMNANEEDMISNEGGVAIFRDDSNGRNESVILVEKALTTVRRAISTDLSELGAPFNFSSSNNRISSVHDYEICELDSPSSQNIGAHMSQLTPQSSGSTDENKAMTPGQEEMGDVFFNEGAISSRHKESQTDEHGTHPDSDTPSNLHRLSGEDSDSGETITCADNDTTPHVESLTSRAKSQSMTSLSSNEKNICIATPTFGSFSNIGYISTDPHSFKEHSTQRVEHWSVDSTLDVSRESNENTSEHTLNTSNNSEITRTIETQTYPERRVIETQTGETTADQELLAPKAIMVDTGVGASPPRCDSPMIQSSIAPEQTLRDISYQQFQNPTAAPHFAPHLSTQPSLDLADVQHISSTLTPVNQTPIESFSGIPAGIPMVDPSEYGYVSEEVILESRVDVCSNAYNEDVLSRVDQSYEAQSSLGKTEYTPNELTVPADTNYYSISNSGANVLDNSTTEYLPTTMYTNYEHSSPSVELPSGAQTNQQNHSAENLDQLDETRVSVDIHSWKNKPDFDDHVMQDIVCQVIDSDPQIERDTIGDHLQNNADPEGIITYPSAKSNDNISINNEEPDIDNSIADTLIHTGAVTALLQPNLDSSSQISECESYNKQLSNVTDGNTGETETLLTYPQQQHGILAQQPLDTHQADVKLHERESDGYADIAIEDIIQPVTRCLDSSDCTLDIEYPGRGQTDGGNTAHTSGQIGTGGIEEELLLRTYSSLEENRSEQPVVDGLQSDIACPVMLTVPSTSSDPSNDDVFIEYTLTSPEPVMVDVTDSLSNSRCDEAQINISTSSEVFGDESMNSYSQVDNTTDRLSPSTAITVNGAQRKNYSSSGTGMDDAPRFVGSRTTSESCTMQDESVEADLMLDYSDELDKLRRERERIQRMLAKDILPSKMQVDMAEAQLNYIIGQTDLLLDTIDDPSDWNPDFLSSQSVTEPQLSAIGQSYLLKHREELEKSKCQIEIRIGQLEKQKTEGHHSRQSRHDFTSLRRQAQQEAFKLERNREQTRYVKVKDCRSKSTSPARSSISDVSSDYGDQLPDTPSQQFFGKILTPKQRQQYLTNQRRSIINSTRRERSCSPQRTRTTTPHVRHHSSPVRHTLSSPHRTPSYSLYANSSLISEMDSLDVISDCSSMEDDSQSLLSDILETRQKSQAEIYRARRSLPSRSYSAR